MPGDARRAAPDSADPGRGSRADRRRAPPESITIRWAVNCPSTYLLTVLSRTVVSLELTLTENAARGNRTVFEEARTIASLLDDFNVPRADLGRRLARSRSDLATPSDSSGCP